MKHLMAAVFCMACVCSISVRAEEPKPTAPAPTIEVKQETVKCQAGCSHCTFNATKQCLPAVKIKDQVFVLAVSANASEETKRFVASLPSMKDDAKPLNVKLTGRTMSGPEAEKVASAVGTEHKVWFEVGEISVEN